MFNIFLILICFSSTLSKKVIACVGDSITKGSGASQISLTSYPSLLQNYFNHTDYHIYNFGYGGATVIKNTTNSYWNTTLYRDALNSDPNIVIILLGTNDAKESNWNENLFIHDYKLLIQSFQSLSTNPKIYICTTPPAYSNGLFGIQQKIINEKLSNIIENIAIDSNLRIIDLFNHLGGNKLYKKYLFINESIPLYTKKNDGIHPNDYGYLEISHAIAVTIIGETVAHKIRLTLRATNEYYNQLKIQEKDIIEKYKIQYHNQ